MEYPQTGKLDVQLGPFTPQRTSAVVTDFLLCVLPISVGLDYAVSLPLLPILLGLFLLYL